MVEIKNDNIQEKKIDDVSLTFKLTSADPDFDNKIPVLEVFATDDDDANIKFVVVDALVDGTTRSSSPADSVVLNAVEDVEKAFEVKLYSQPNSTVDIEFTVSEPAGAVGRNNAKRPQPQVSCDAAKSWARTCKVVFEAGQTDWKKSKKVKGVTQNEDVITT